MIAITDKQTAQIKALGWGGISFNFDHETNTITIKQGTISNGYILNQKQLNDRARKIFPDKNIKIRPIVFTLQVEDITENWILNQMEIYGIKRNDLIKQLALDKTYLSLLFADKQNPRKINLSRPMKAMFFYYFLNFRLNKQLRTQKD